MNLTRRNLTFAVVVFGFVQVAAASSLPPTWTSAVGTPISSWSSGNYDSGLATVYFPSDFSFSLFGQTYNSVTVSSDGSLYFGGSPGNAQPQATVTELLQGLPRISAAWYDIDAIDGVSSIMVNTSLPGEAVFTWQDVASYVPETGQTVAASNLATFQVTLDSDGDVIFAYRTLNSLDPATTGQANSLTGSQQAILGITNGYGASDPGSTDLSAMATSPSFSYTTSNSTIYQLIDNNPPDNSNLAGLDLIFAPQSNGGWQVTSQYGTSGGQSPAPEPATIAELALASVVLLVWWYRRSPVPEPCPRDTR